MGMMRSRNLLAALLALGCLTMAACSSNTPTVPKAVQLSLTAPTDGARVSVARLLVLGTVDPPGARVSIGGHHVHVANGTFRDWITVHRGVTHIAIRASAAGFLDGSLRVAVRDVSRRVAIPRSPTSALSNFLNRANQACSQAVTRLDGFDFGHIDTGVSPQVAIQRANLAASVGAGLVRRLRAIKAPPKQAPGYTAFIDNFQGLVGQLNGAVAAGGAGQSTAALTLISNTNATLAALIQQGSALELYLCAGGLGTG